MKEPFLIVDGNSLMFRAFHALPVMDWQGTYTNAIFGFLSMVLSFIGSWEDFMGALLYLNKPNMYTVAYALKMFNDSSQTDFGATFAMSFLSLMPILVIFFFFQKQLVEGISTQGLKG